MNFFYCCQREGDWAGPVSSFAQYENLPAVSGGAVRNGAADTPFREYVSECIPFLRRRRRRIYMLSRERSPLALLESHFVLFLQHPSAPQASPCVGQKGWEH
jgi:hypothetical protein